MMLKCWRDMSSWKERRWSVDETEVARVKGKAAVSHLEIETRAAERAVLEWHADADGLRLIDKAMK